MPVFAHPALLQTALTHKSYVHEHPAEGPHNERLEFLGDAVLGLVITQLLMERHEYATEGELSSARSQLVSEAILAELAREMNLGEQLRLGKGELQNQGQQKNSLLANAFEALVGALSLDSDLATVRMFVTQMYGARLDAWREHTPIHAKSQLQTWAQARFHVAPHYDILAEQGPDHQKHFLVGVSIQDRLLAQAEGKSKREAEQKAAQLALYLLQKEELA